MNYFLFFQALLSKCFILGIIPIFIKIIFNHGNLINQTSKEQTTNITSSLERRTNTIISIFSISCILLLFLYFFYKQNHIVIFFLITLLVVDNINKGYFYSGKLVKILNSFKNDNLSIGEWEVILGFIYFISLIFTYKIPNKLINYINNIENGLIADLLLLLFLFAFSVLSIFLSGLLLFEFIKFFLQIIPKIINPILSNKAKKLFIRIEYLFNKEIREYKTISYFRKNKQKTIMFYLSSTIFVIIDVMYDIFYIFCNLIIGILFYILIIMYRIFKSLKDLKFWIFKLSDRKVTVIIFRVSFILALISLVTFNRISPLVKMEIESTEILEFIASSLIIPLVLSWIMEYNNLRNSENKNKNLILYKRRILSRRKYK